RLRRRQANCHDWPGRRGSLHERTDRDRSELAARAGTGILHEVRQAVCGRRRGSAEGEGAEEVRRISFVLPAVMLCASLGSAKTLTLTDEDADRMAQIAENAPRSSWVGSEIGTGVWYNASFDLGPNRAFLIRYPLDQIPKDQK